MSLRGANQVLNSTWERRGNPCLPAGRSLPIGRLKLAGLLRYAESNSASLAMTDTLFNNYEKTIYNYFCIVTSLISENHACRAD